MMAGQEVLALLLQLDITIVLKNFTGILHADSYSGYNQNQY